MKILLTLIVITLLGIIALMLVMARANGPDEDDERNGTVGRGDCGHENRVGKFH